MNKKILSVNLFLVALVVFGGLFMLLAEAPASADNADVSCSSATLWGTVYTSGEDTDAWFDWGPTTSLQYFTPKQSFSKEKSSYTFSQFLSPLRENTTYYWRAMAQNRFGTATRSLKYFSTLTCHIPPPPPSPP